MANARSVVESLLAKAGVKVNGPSDALGTGARPWDITVHDDRVFARILAQGSLGLGESYMDGWWDSESLDETMARIMRANLEQEVKLTWSFIWAVLKALVSNRQSRGRAFQVGEEHYDLGNDLYEAMLDTRMIYTCGYWSSPTAPAVDLDAAQEAKLDLICRKVGLKEGDRILDIGCGWGGFLKFAAEKYGVSGVGITVSEEQAKLAREKCAGLPIEIRVEDYREVTPSTSLGAGEQFDHIISIGMFEHVGYKNYRSYFEMAHRCLKDGGIFLLHTIGGNFSVRTGDAWLDKYIFPNGMLPSIAQIGRGIEKLFVMEDWHNFGPDYDKTLMAWFTNFDYAWPTLKERYGERFYRMWKYYLLICAAVFRARDAQLWQIVLTKHGRTGGYQSVR